MTERARRTTWLFTRGGDSVRLEVRRGSTGPQLVVRGPGSRRRYYDCADDFAVLAHQAEIASRLRSQGFDLELFITERRRHPRDEP